MKIQVLYITLDGREKANALARGGPYMGSPIYPTYKVYSDIGPARDRFSARRPKNSLSNRMKAFQRSAKEEIAQNGSSDVLFEKSRLFVPPLLSSCAARRFAAFAQALRGI